MALLWLDSFDHYATADLVEKYAAAFGSSLAILPTGGRRTSGALQLLSGTVVPTITPTGAVAIVGVAYNQAQGHFANGAWNGIEVWSGATVQLRLTLNTSGRLEVYRGASVALLGTASLALTASTFQFIELKATIDPSAGAVVVRVGEAEVLNLTGVNTAQTGVAGWSAVAINSLQPGLSNNLFDDLYILDGSGPAPLNTLLGDCRVDARLPTAEGASSAWTPLSGTDNALMVDDPTPDDDTTYNSTATINATDTHVVQDAPVVGATLYGVQVSLSAKKTAAGTCSVAPVVRHSGTDYDGTPGNPTTSYAYLVTPYGTNPGTGAAWTEAGFNAAEFGYKRTA